MAIPLEEFRTLWNGLVGPIRSLFNFDYVIENFYALIENLFALIAPAPISPAAGMGGGGRLTRLGSGAVFPRSSSVFRPYFSHDIRNAIINGGRSQTLVDLVYEGISRIVEPYKLEYRVRKSDNRGLEYFWAYDPLGSGRSRTPGIRQYICEKIQTVTNTNSNFSPRFEIEL